MTEAEWLASEEPERMLRFLGVGLPDRKLRLFAVACCRRVWDLLTDRRSRIAVRQLEEYADNLGSERLRRDAYNTAHPAYLDLQSVASDPTSSAACAVLSAAYPIVPPRLRDQERPLWSLFGNLEGNLATALRVDAHGLHRVEAGIIRELFGNPFRPVVFDPAWRTSDVMLLATGIYEDRAFDRMPILADALQDAGCTSDDILNHCRDPHATHVRGCWGLDLLLGKA
jgi:hypothetical protein